MRKNDDGKSRIARGAEPRDVNTNPLDQNLGFGQAHSGRAFSEQIPEVWKNRAFIGMSFTIEKCRDLT
jgi:hypothetical protein